MPWLYAESHRDRKAHPTALDLDALIYKIYEPDPVAAVEQEAAIATHDAHLVTQLAGVGLKASEISAEEYQKILATRYTEPNGE